MSANIETICIPSKFIFKKIHFFFKSTKSHFRLLLFIPILLPLQFVKNIEMELIGTVKKLFDVQTFNSGFQKRELILLTQEQYPQPISIEFLSDKIDLLNTISEGEQVKIGINIRGREWQAPDGQIRYFNSITGWRVEKATGDFNEPVQAAPMQANQSTASQDTNVFGNDDDDDLPF